MVALHVLGPPVLHAGGLPLALPSRKCLAIVVLLALDPVPWPRARLAAMLWPALAEPLARRNLRRELARLRDAGAASAWRVDGDLLAAGETLELDLAAFDRACRDGRPDDALTLWRGAPLDGFELDDAGPFDEWLAHRRSELAHRRRKALQASAKRLEEQGDAASALARIEALLADDPLQEAHQRDAMRLLSALGRREAALSQFEACRDLLRRELDLAPMAETEALASALRGGKTSVAVSAPTVSAASLATAPLATAAGKVHLPERLPFAGRNDEVARLEAAWSAGLTVVVEGEAGVGKSRLATDFAAAHGPYAMARCRAGDAELPYSSFGRALRALMGPAPVHAAWPGWIGPELARLLPELGDAPTPIRSDEERSRFFEACARAWESLAAESFDAVVIDDWHHADAASRALLAFIARRRSEAGRSGTRELLLLRPELDAAADESLQGLVDATGAVRLRLQALPAEAVLDLIERLSGAVGPARFAGRLQRATGGNPFFLAETLRHLVEADLLSADAAGAWQTPFDDATLDYRELPLPDSVLETVMARVQRLPAASRRVLEAAALAEEPFVPAWLAPACALSEIDAVLAIESAVLARLLREHESGGFAFAHDLARQALAGSVSPDRRRLVHRRLALGAETAGAAPATIAAHHEASGDPGRAVVHRVTAGDRAQDLHALPEAMAHWQKALDDGASAAVAIALHERIASAATHRADRDAIAAQADALGRLIAAGGLAPGERIAASVARAIALANAGAGGEALAETDRIADRVDDGHRGRYLRARCMALHSVGRSDEAMDAARSALALADLPDPDRVELLDMAFIADHNAGRIDSALAHTDAALALSLRTGNAHGIARSRYRRGLQLLQRDDVDGAEAELLAAVDDCERFGFVRTERVALYNLSCAYSARGAAAEALAAAERAQSLNPPLQPGPLSAVLAAATVDAQQALGDLGAAWRAAATAVEHAIDQDEEAVRMIVADQSLEILGLVGETDLARRLLASIPDEALGQIVNAASGMWVALAQFELALGDAAAASRALAQLDLTGGPVEERVRVRRAQVRSAIALARADSATAMAALPKDDTPGMNDELRTRGLALRVAAEAAAGRLTTSTREAACVRLATPGGHALALLSLHAALVRAVEAGTDASLPVDARIDSAGLGAQLADRVAALARTLRDHPLQEAAFGRTWSRN